MPTARSRKCGKCGMRHDGACPSNDASKRVADLVKEKIRTGDTGTGPVCPFCRAEIDWENVGTIETEITIYVREKIYFCPSCRAFLGVSSWHTEG